MKPGQIAQLQELRKCYMQNKDDAFVYVWVDSPWTDRRARMTEWDKKMLRRLWHAYRGQIAAMRKNRKA
jgi:hypothetical protein